MKKACLVMIIPIVIFCGIMLLQGDSVNIKVDGIVETEYYIAVLFPNNSEVVLEI